MAPAQGLAALSQLLSHQVTSPAAVTVNPFEWTLFLTGDRFYSFRMHVSKNQVREMETFLIQMRRPMLLTNIIAAEEHPYQ